MVFNGMPRNALLPNVTIFGTGGTIAGSAASNTETTGYTPGAIGVQTLINAVPELLEVANIESVQVSNVRSTELTSEILLKLSQQITTALKSDTCQGVVITHGTDTLEETAYFLSLTVRSEKPVVLVGAMRPATAISADGPGNLLQAVILAASKEGMGRGPLVVLNDRISSAYYTTKTSANALDTFKSIEQGYLGYFDNFRPKFFYTPAMPMGLTYFDVAEATDLPQVDILYGHHGLNPRIPLHLVNDGAKGIVLATMGNGGWTVAGDEILKQILSQGIPVVRSHKTQDGAVSRSKDVGITSGLLNPQKSRILLQFALHNNYTLEEIRSIFEI